MNVSQHTNSLFRRLRYKHLLMLVTLGSSQNVHRAAETLSMSQPATTRMLQEIEEAFGCELFERLNRGIRPNALGLDLIRFAQTALNQLDRCAEGIAEKSQGGHGSLAIGTIMGAAPNLVIQSVAEMKRRFPKLRIKLMGDTSDQLIELLDKGLTDLAVARRNLDSDRSRFDFEPLGNERLIITVHHAHPLARRESLDLEELVTNWPWILQPQTSPARLALEQSLERMSLPSPSDVIECSSVFAMLQLVQMTDGILFLSDTVLKDYLRTGLVVALPVEFSEKMTPYGILTRRNTPPSQEMEQLVMLLREQSKSIPLTH
ncbi:HTH-type transcriptional regulator GbpR [compost metagenome]